MMQVFYLLAMQQARRRTLLAALACLAAMISLVLAGRALLSAPAVPASAAISYTVPVSYTHLAVLWVRFAGHTAYFMPRTAFAGAGPGGTAACVPYCTSGCSMQKRPP